MPPATQDASNCRGSSSSSSRRRPAAGSLLVAIARHHVARSHNSSSSPGRARLTSAPAATPSLVSTIVCTHGMLLLSEDVVQPCGDDQLGMLAARTES